MMTPLKAIRAKCIDCSCGNMAEVNRCPIESCALYPFQFGKNPNRKGIGGRFDNLGIQHPTQRSISATNALQEYKDTTGIIAAENPEEKPHTATPDQRNAV